MTSTIVGSMRDDRQPSDAGADAGPDDPEDVAAADDGVGAPEPDDEAEADEGGPPATGPQADSGPDDPEDAAAAPASEPVDGVPGPREPAGRTDAMISAASGRARRRSQVANAPDRQTSRWRPVSISAGLRPAWQRCSSTGMEKCESGSIRRPRSGQAASGERPSADCQPARGTRDSPGEASPCCCTTRES